MSSVAESESRNQETIIRFIYIRFIYIMILLR